MRFNKAVIFSSALFIFIVAAILFLPKGLVSAKSEIGWDGPVNSAVQPSLTQPRQSQPVVIYFFWGDGCPHCANAKPFLFSLPEKYPTVVIRDFEIWFVEENRPIFEAMVKAYGEEPKAVPTIMLGEKYWVGYSDEIEKEIQAEVEKCLVNGCLDKGLGIVPTMTANQSLEITAVETETPTGVSEPTQPVPVKPAAPVEPAGSTGETGAGELITVPFIGSVDLSSKSLWLSTLLIAIVDGVNPCSIWVLTMLLAITLHAGSRKKVVIIGLVFLTVTAGIYALFIAGMFTMLTVISFVWWIQILVALISLFFAVINIKDYFWYKEGLSFTIADDKKPGIFARMRKVVDASQSFWGLVGATAVLAAGVSLVEFSCTAGFPVLWTNILVAQSVGGMTFVLLLLFYLAIYQLDEMAIFFTAVYSLKASKLEEKHGRLLKLIGGMLMLALALVMLIDPALMNNLSSSLWIFGGAFAATLVVLFLHRFLLPRLGIRLGSEDASRRKGKVQRRKKRS